MTYKLYKKEGRGYIPTGDICTPVQDGDALVFPPTPEGHEWRRDDGDSVGVGGRSNAIDDINARNAVRTWGRSGERNPRTGKYY